MKHFLILVVVLAFMPESIADRTPACIERVESRAILKMPTSTIAQHELRKGRCYVEVRFKLLESGKTIDHKAAVDEKRCEAFVESALLSIKETVFKVGDSVENCQIRIGYEYDSAA